MRNFLTPAMLASARRAQESIMTATGVIRAPGDGWRHNPDTGRDEPVRGDTIYEGPMRVQQQTGAATVDAAGELVTRPAYACAIPWHVTTLRPGHTVEVTDSDDPDTPTRLVVDDVERNHMALTARHFTAHTVEALHVSKSQHH